ncbi:hypothetical protein WN944_009712 [Citrus x changshan-huyou]|uniref:Cysteine proteinase inhibitor n=1 Tax=Citrus x changshan-huyou TaxID=2935761 RepID=A0AAP0MSP2_9ROSI
MATVGGVREVEGTANNQEIVNLARFAVDEHNKKQNSNLQFVKVVSAKQQVVSGTLYDITLEAVEGGQKKLFEAKVWEKPWMQFKELKEFNPVAQSHSSTA